MTFTHNNQTYELILLHTAGSRLYGNSTPQSDFDIRGVFIASKETKLGILGSVEQLQGVELYKSLKTAGLDIPETEDILIYEINRFVKLASDANPNIMDTICFDYTNSNFTLYYNEKGKKLIDNKHLFISARLKFTFSGYAISQLNKVRNRDKYLTKCPDVSEVLKEIKECYDNKFIDFNWICDNFGGEVAIFLSDDDLNKMNNRLEKCITWDEFKSLVEDGRKILSLQNINDIDTYRIPQLINYVNPKDLRGKSLGLNFWVGPLTEYKGTIKQLLYTSASCRTFSNSMLAIYTEGNGIFTKEGKLKSQEQEHIGDFVCLLSIDQMKYKSDKDFNSAMWEWKCKRNIHRSALEAEFGYDLKNVSHLVRLMECAKDILITGTYNPTLTGERLQLVKDVRAGKFTYEEVLQYALDNDKMLDELYKKTTLPKKVNMNKINDLLLELQDIL